MFNESTFMRRPHHTKNDNHHIVVIKVVIKEVWQTHLFNNKIHRDIYTVKKQNKRTTLTSAPVITLVDFLNFCYSNIDVSVKNIVLLALTALNSTVHLLTIKQNHAILKNSLNLSLASLKQFTCSAPVLVQMLIKTTMLYFLWYICDD